MFLQWRQVFIKACIIIPVGYDIHTTILTLRWLCAVAFFLLLLSGIQAIRVSKTVRFFRIRKQQKRNGQRLIIGAFLVLFFAFLLWRIGEPLAYRIYPPTQTLTKTPTITLTPTITQTPTITLTPTITETPAITNTPFLPANIQAEFSSSVTPNPKAIFSPLEFTQKIANARAVNPAQTFKNPVGHLYAVFSYNNMVSGSQWTAIWYRGNEVVYYESKPWDGGIGGWGYTDWNPTPDKWQPGQYLVVIFVGLEAKLSGAFVVEGQPVTISLSTSVSPSTTATLISSRTARPTDTRWPTDTRTP
jgi:hypothetical protein